MVKLNDKSLLKTLFADLRNGDPEAYVDTYNLISFYKHMLSDKI